MKRPITFALALSVLGVSIPAQSQTARQERIKSCHQQSTELKIEKNKWQAFMKSCVDGKRVPADKGVKSSADPTAQ